jgi:hypothetical protein
VKQAILAAARSRRRLDYAKIAAVSAALAASWALAYALGRAFFLAL